jgi:hypothetical protein
VRVSWQPECSGGRGDRDRPRAEFGGGVEQPDYRVAAPLNLGEDLMARLAAGVADVRYARRVDRVLVNLDNSQLQPITGV